MAWSRQKPENESFQAHTPETPTRKTPKVDLASGPITQRGEGADQRATLGKSIYIKGDLTGNEDLTIEGKVEGKILLKDHALTFGTNSRIQAEVRARSVVVLGEMRGDITADDRVEIAATGSMQGDIKAPRVVLKDGARFKGGVDMDTQPTEKAAAASQTMVATAGQGDGPTHRAAGEPRDRQGPR